MNEDRTADATVAGLHRRLQEAVEPSRAATTPADAAKDLLALALGDIAAHHGTRVLAATLTHGLPLTNGRLPLEHVASAAARANLAVEIVTCTLNEIGDAQLPLILLLKSGGADILWHIERAPSGTPLAAVASEPGQPAARARIDIAELTAAASGRAITLRPTIETQAAGLGLPGDARPTDWFFSAFKSGRQIYAEAILATVAINVLALAMPLFTMNVYDRVLPNAAVETLWALAIGVLLATAFDLAIKVLRARFVDVAGQRADVVLANLVFGRVLGARLSAAQAATGVRANTLREFETLREFFNSAALTTFGDLPFLLVFVVMIAVVAGSLVVVPLIAIPLILAAAWLTQKRIARLSETQFREMAVKSAVAVETLSGLESIKAAGAESWAASKWERAVAANIRTGNEMRHLSTVGLNALFGLQTAVQIVMIIIGFYMVAAGSITMGALIAATMLAGRAMQPLGQVAALISRLNQARTAYRMLDQMVQAPQERAEGAPLLSPRHMAGLIELDAVSFAYEKDASPALRDVSFTLRPGERVAIVGGIGSGKTTVLKLIHALHMPTSGRVQIDGLPVGHIDPAVLRRNVGLALQDGELFQGTLRENICLGDNAASDDAIIRAARLAGAFDWISRLPKGLETPIRERGAGLSGGQKQSVALARALLGDPRIVLLDEPTSDMDSGTEGEIVRRLSEGLTGRTIVIVTHRPAMLKLVDRIIVLEYGRKILDAPKASALASMAAMASRSAAVKVTPTKVAATGADTAKAEAS